MDKALVVAGAALSISFIMMACAYGMSKIMGKAVDAMARQPEVAQRIASSLVLPLGCIEGATFLAVIAVGYTATNIK